MTGRPACSRSRGTRTPLFYIWSFHRYYLRRCVAVVTVAVSLCDIVKSIPLSLWHWKPLSLLLLGARGWMRGAVARLQIQGFRWPWFKLGVVTFCRFLEWDHVRCSVGSEGSESVCAAGVLKPLHCTYEHGRIRRNKRFRLGSPECRPCMRAKVKAQNSRSRVV